MEVIKEEKDILKLMLYTKYSLEKWDYVRAIRYGEYVETLERNLFRIKHKEVDIYKHYFTEHVLKQLKNKFVKLS